MKSSSIFCQNPYSLAMSRYCVIRYSQLSKMSRVEKVIAAFQCGSDSHRFNYTRWANLWHLNSSSVDPLQKLWCEWLRASSPGGKPSGSAPEVRKWASTGCLSQHQQVSQDSAVCSSHSQSTVKCCINNCLRSTDILCLWTALESSVVEYVWLWAMGRFFSVEILARKDYTCLKYITYSVDHFKNKIKFLKL